MNFPLHSDVAECESWAKCTVLHSRLCRSACSRGRISRARAHHDVPGRRSRSSFLCDVSLRPCARRWKLSRSWSLRCCLLWWSARASRASQASSCCDCPLVSLAWLYSYSGSLSFLTRKFQLISSRSGLADGLPLPGRDLHMESYEFWHFRHGCPPEQRIFEL